jgi:hypothetical protein
LLAACGDADAKVRRDAVAALRHGDAKEAPQEVVAALREVLEKDPAYGPRAEALRGLGKFGVKDALPAVLAHLATPSDREQLARAALDALLELDPAAARDAAFALAARGSPEIRDDGLRALPKVLAKGEDPQPAIDLALAALDARSRAVKRAAFDALAALGADAALERLDALAANETAREFDRRAAGNAAKAIREKAGKRSEFDDLRREIEALEKRLDAGPVASPVPAAASAAPAAGE